MNYEAPNESSHESRVAQVVEQMLKDRSIVQTVAPDDVLIEAGLTSLDLVKLVFRVESEFDLTIPVGDITPANFRTITTIRALVSHLLEA
jgi:acyl carrier protein